MVRCAAYSQCGWTKYSSLWKGCWIFNWIKNGFLLANNYCQLLWVVVFPVIGEIYFRITLTHVLCVVDLLVDLRITLIPVLWKGGVQRLKSGQFYQRWSEQAWFQDFLKQCKQRHNNICRFIMMMMSDDCCFVMTITITLSSLWCRWKVIDSAGEERFEEGDVVTVRWEWKKTEKVGTFYFHEFFPKRTSRDPKPN